MGKNKQAQRTKNNARPSNSSRSAELLGPAMPNFVGFSAVKDGGYVPVLPGLSCSMDEVEMNSVDSNFQVVLKKMSKKDATTKYKALQEFAALCQSAEMPAVIGMLPFWPRLYCALSIDIDHRVREAAQVAHAAVVKRIGKGIAMYLKQLAGAWFTSQYDTYPPAASAAVKSFNSTFPPWKIVDAIVHCQREILLYITDNITVQTAQTLSTQKSLTAEEMETKYQRVLAANLQGYSSYFKKVPFHEIDKTLEIHEKILSNSKFWKLAKHDALPIRAAFFNVLTSIMENAKKLLQNEEKRTVTAIMNSLDESEPSVLPAVWESMLVAINQINDWHHVVNIDKLVLPKLWRVLRSGGQCCASIVYPNLLPFVSQFPKLSVDTNDLYTNFFDNMRQGFSVKSVQMSRWETMAVARSFVECLRYSILVNTENVDLCIQLFKEQLMPIVEACMTDENVSMKQVCFTEITYLVRYWSKNRANEEYKSYVLLMQQFWIELRLLFAKLINVPQETVASHTIETKGAEIEFLLTLKNAPDCRRKELKVKFSDPNDSVVSKSRVKPAQVDPVFTAELDEFVNALCVIYFNKINDEQSTEYIEQLTELTKHFASKELFVALSESSNSGKDFYEFYNKSLRPVLLKNSEATGQILELIFYFITYTNDAEKDKILRSLIELNDTTITRNVIRCSLSKHNRDDHVIKQWYTQTSVTKLLIDVAEEIVSPEHDNVEKDQDLILLAFETSQSGDLLINEEAANEIVSILCDSLNGMDDTCFMQYTALITKLMTLLWDHKHMTSSAVQIMETLLGFCTRGHDDSDLISAATVRNSWKDGLVRSSQILSCDKFNNLIKRCAIIIWCKVYNANTTHLKDILIDLATDILDVIINNNNVESEHIEKTILLFLTVSNIELWIREATSIAIYGEIVTGNLCILSIENMDDISIFQHSTFVDVLNDEISDNTATCLSWASFTTDLLNNLCKRQRDSYIEDVNASSNPEEDVKSYDINLPGIKEILVNIIYVATVAEIYSKHYKSTKCYNDVNKFLDSLKSSFVNLEKHFAEYIRDDVLHYMRLNHENYGYMLPYMIRMFCAEFGPSEDPLVCYKSCRGNFGTGYIQAIQVLNDYWDPANVSSLTDHKIDGLVSTRIAMSLQRDKFAVPTIMKNIMKDMCDYTISHKCRDFSGILWHDLVFAMEGMRLFAEFVQKAPLMSEIDETVWDFIPICLVTWQEVVDKFEPSHTDIKVIALTIAISQLFYEFQTLLNEHERKSIPGLPPTLLDEWKNVYAGEISNRIVQTWIFYADLHNQDTTTIKSTIPLDYLGKAIGVLDKNMLFKKSDRETETMDFDKMLKLSLELLRSPIPSVQLGAYHVLKHMVAELVQRDKILVESDNFEPSSLNIRKLEEVLLSMQNIVNTMLIEFKLCDTISCTIQPFTDSYTYTLGYLLAWAIVLDICANAHDDLRYQYAEILKNDFFPCLLNNIFKLMPVEVLQDNKNKNVILLEIFTTVPSFNFGESWTEWRLDHIVCWLYTNCLRHLPVLVRQWWSTAESRVSATIDKITSHYVSPMLCQEELLNNKLVNLENMQVKVHPTAREVVALYQMDDTKLELSIVLPSNHPLGTVTVEPGQHAGGTANWRNCHMQLSIFLTHQNGSVWDGLTMWKRNLDKKFAGVEECYICFSIFHISTYQIPKLSCHTCRKKFHTPCLYKWFNTSQKSTCPICRNVF